MNVLIYNREVASLKRPSVARTLWRPLDSNKIFDYEGWSILAAAWAVPLLPGVQNFPFFIIMKRFAVKTMFTFNRLRIMFAFI